MYFVNTIRYLTLLKFNYGIVQAHLKPATAAKLKEAVPQISEEDLQEMMKIPSMRSFDPSIIQEPFVYRMVELMQHYGSG